MPLDPEFSERFTHMVFQLLDKVSERLTDEQIRFFKDRLAEGDSFAVYDILKESDVFVESMQRQEGNIFGTENVDELFQGLTRSVDAMGTAIHELAHWEDVHLKSIENHFPLLGAMEGGSPHVAILGKTGCGKSFYTKRLVKFLAKKKDRAVIIFDRHREYTAVSDYIVQFATKDMEATDLRVPVHFVNIEDVLDALEMRDMSMGGGSTADAIGFAANMALRKRIEDTLAPNIDWIFEKMVPGNIVSLWLDAPDSAINDETVKQMLTRLMKKAMRREFKATIVIINEEAQNMLDDRGILHPWVKSICREGRKFGIYLVSLSQRPDIGDDVISQSILYIFKLWPKDIDEAAGNIFQKEMKAEISNLTIGEHIYYDEKEGSWVKNFLNIGSLDPALRTAEAVTQSRRIESKKDKKKR